MSFCSLGLATMRTCTCMYCYSKEGVCLLMEGSCSFEGRCSLSCSGSIEFMIHLKICHSSLVLRLFGLWLCFFCIIWDVALEQAVWYLAYNEKSCFVCKDIPNFACWMLGPILCVFWSLQRVMQWLLKLYLLDACTLFSSFFTATFPAIGNE
ncbi:hypothetical protein DUNSADRAFT_7075 [Dunaliella salina]|uniref:Uncharacterized protein n=1 Tax=Dunaliella salina TaxID=3046 RepID=A0ABQ7H6H2_DUNSA|nr:hypothetical protein DUNSADRAFT_7075 [Dunaliella salina]|eukprot:KAF5842465.1 hypothetical protein DUNSADRAFT_7075 [Dunaliella salina]